MNQNPKEISSSSFPLSPLIATIISPAIIFYVGGCLLSFGYFGAMGPGLLTAFSPTELALAGFARITTSMAALAVLAVLLTIVASAWARFTVPAASTPIRDRLLGLLCILDGVLIASALFTMGLYSSLLGITGVALITIIGVALLMGWDERVKGAMKPAA